MGIETRGSGDAPAYQALARDRQAWLTGSLLIAVAAGAWVAVVVHARNMQGMTSSQPDMGMPIAAQPGWLSLGGGIAFAVAWGVMMTAMMLPSATPMVALYGTVRRNLSQTSRPGVPAIIFALVYLLLWLATGIPVYFASAVITHYASAYPAIGNLLPYGLAVVVIASGVYQFTPLKRVCLRVCSSPLAFLIGRWREGYRGTLELALEHAVSCIGCCWGLMLVLVAAGAMSLPWVLLIAASVFVEKVLPHGERTAQVIGILLVVLGLLIAAQPGLAASLQGTM